MQRFSGLLIFLAAMPVGFRCLGQQAEYQLAPTMNSRGSITKWQNENLDPTAPQFGADVSRKRDVSRYQSGSADPNREAIDSSHLLVGRANLGSPIVSRRPQAPPKKALATSRRVDSTRRFVNQRTSPVVDPLTPATNPLKLRATGDLEASPSDRIPAPRNLESSTTPRSSLPLQPASSDASTTPNDNDVKTVAPEIIHTQRLPRVQQPAPTRLPYIIGESPGEGPSLFDVYRLPNTDNTPHAPIVIQPRPPVVDPKVDASITGIAMPDLPPVKREEPAPAKPDLLLDPQPPAVSEYATTDLGYSAEALNDLDRKTFDLADLESRRTGTWWNSQIPQRLLRFKNTRQMTLADAFRASLKFSPELVALTAEIDRRGYEIVRQDANFDWTLFVESIWAHNDDPVGDQLQGAANRLEVNDHQTTAGGRKQSRFGGNTSVSYRSGFRDSNSSFFTPPNQANARLSLDVTQPLLRGAGLKVNEATIELARNSHQVSVEELQSGIEQQLQAVATAYWDLVSARGLFLQARASWHRSHKLLDIVEKRKNIDAGIDNLNRVRSTTASRYSQTVSAEYNVVRAQEALLRLMFGSNYAQQQGFELITSSLPTDNTESSDVNVDVELALANRPEIRRSLRQINSGAIEFDVARNQLLPVLDVVLSAYSASLRGDKNYTGAFRDHFKDSNPGISGGLNFELPVQNRAATARERQTVANLKRLEAELQTTAADVALEIRDRWLARAQAATDLPLRAKALVSAHEDLAYVEARKRYLADGAGFTDLYLDNILRAQDRLQGAETQMLRAQIGYSISQIDLGRAKGLLRQSVIGAPNAQFPEPAVVD